MPKRLLILLVLLCLTTSAMAQDGTSEKERDLVLYRTVMQAAEKMDLAAMEKMLFADGVGAKQSFVRLLRRTLAGEPDVLDVPNRRILFWLARGIDVYFQDPGPKKLIAGFEKGVNPTPEEVDQYQKSITMPMPPTSYEAGMRDARLYVDGVRIMRPSSVKGVRFMLSVLMRNVPLIVQEVDTMPQAVEETRASFKANNVPKEQYDAFFEGENLKEMNRQVQIGKRSVMLEFGLLENSAESSADVAALSGFRVAYRRSQPDLAEAYLQKLKTLLKTPGVNDPLLNYAAATSDYQLRKLRGYRPSPQDVVKEFSLAWKELEPYRPGLNVLLDYETAELLWSNHFWLDELARNREVSRPAARTMVLTYSVWAGCLRELPKTVMTMKPDEHLMNPSVVVGLLSVCLTTWDGFLGLQERFPEVYEGTKLKPSTIAEVSLACVDMALSLVNDLALQKSGPPYDLASEGLIPELQGRVALLQSTLPETTPTKRKELLTQAATLLRRAGNPEIGIPYLVRVGNALQESGDSSGAISLWREAMQTADRMGYSSLSVEAAILAAKELARTGKWEEAETLATHARELLKDNLVIATDLERDLGKVTDLIVEAHLRAEQPEKALAAISVGKQLQSASVQVESSKAVRGELRALEQSKQEVAFLDAQVARVSALPQSQTRAQLLQQSEKTLADTRADYLTRSREIRQKNSELYSATLKFDPLDLVAIQKQMAPEVLVAQYFATDKELYIFLVGRDTFRVRSQPISSADLNKTTLSFLRTVRAARPNDPAVASSSQALYQLLVKPIAADLAGRSTLILIPSGRLNILPFAALTDADGKSLLDSVSLIELAKPADLTQAAASKAKLETVVAFANATGDLPAAEKEGAQIAKLFPTSKVFQGKDASRENFLANSGHSDILHLATHGEWNIDDSLQNYLSFAGNQRLGQDDIFALSLDDTSLVILSACNTAMGDSGDVKFVASLAEAFWLAGSQSVVASLWAVDDESTALLMTEFYAALRAGTPKAEALRKAQIAVRANPAFTHPYYWSGFVLFGQWR